MVTITNGIPRKIQLDPLRHRFHRKAALWLTLATFVLLITLSVFFGDFSHAQSSSSSSRWLVEAQDDDSNDNDDFTQFSCRYIYEKVPDAGEQQCRFARTCNNGEGLWAPFVFCHYNKFSALTLFLMISPIMIIWLVTLFRMLGSTAEDFFSPCLEMFSVKLGLPPRFAGVTLLALGNGAGDVSSTNSAIINDVDNGYKFSLGALTGAAMLVGGVIAGLVVLAADGVPCRGALVRDVTALFITVVVVWATFSTGTIGSGSTTLFLSMYGVFVSVVLVADIYHRAVVLPRLKALQALRASDGTVDESAQASDATNMGPAGGVLSRVITAISNYDHICSGDTTTTIVDDGNGSWGVSSGNIPTAEQRGASLQESDAPIILHGQNGLLTPERHHHHPNHHPEQSATDLAAEAGGGGAYELIHDQILDQVCLADGSTGFSAVNWSGALHDCKQEVMTSLNETWEDIAYNGDLNAVEKAMLICEFPFTILRKSTVSIPCEGYYNRGMIALSIAICPLWFAYYIWVGHEVNLLSKNNVTLFLVVWALAIGCGFAIIRYAPGGEGMMTMAVAGPIGLVGFIIAASWIDYIADHVVSLLDFVGTILHIPGSIMGLTVLAWGNSIGDLSANVTMARKGLANMAMTACFAGPVFNILVGLGLGFSGLAAKTGIPEAEVSITAPILTGFISVMINCISILVVGLMLSNGRIETSYGYLALALYVTYVIVSISLEFSKYGGN